jgi:hypothetical protein
MQSRVFNDKSADDNTKLHTHNTHTCMYACMYIYYAKPSRTFNDMQ